GVAVDCASAGRPVRASGARLSDVPAMVCRPDVAVRTRAAEAQGVPGDPAGVPVPGGEQSECCGNQLSDAQGSVGVEAFAGAGEPVVTAELNGSRLTLASPAPGCGRGQRRGTRPRPARPPRSSSDGQLSD